MMEERPSVLHRVAQELERYRNYLRDLPTHYHLEDACAYWGDQIQSLLDGGYDARHLEAQRQTMEIMAAARRR